MLKIKNNLIKGSIILLVLFGVYNLFNFVFQSLMAYRLSIADFGILGALYYIVYFMGIFTESIQTVITKYVSTESDEGKIKNLLKRAIRKGLFVSFVLFIIYLLISILLVYLTKIPYPLFALTGLVIFFFILLPLTRGALQGRKRFFALGSSLVVESAVKLAFSVLFVFLGMKVYGAMLGTILGLAVSFLISLIPLEKILKSKEKSAETLNIYSCSGPIFILVFSLIAFYTIDIIIAQIVFPKDIAGYYTIASILSKVIFWGTQPVSKAMFPIVAESSVKKSQAENHKNYLISLGLVVFLCLCALAIFYFFSPEIIKLFSGKVLPDPALLFYLSVGTSILSIANLNILYKASTGKTKGYWIFILILAVGISLMLVLNSDLIEFALSFIISSVLFFISSIMLLRAKKRE